MFTVEDNRSGLWDSRFMSDDAELERPLLAHADGLMKAACEEDVLDEPEGTVIVTLSATLCRRIAGQLRDADRQIHARATSTYLVGMGIGALIGVAVMGLIGWMT